MATDDTTLPDGGTQDPDASGSPDADGAASQGGADEVSVLKSRFAGQTAKVNSLTSENATLKEQLAAAQKARDEALNGVTKADEAAKALLEAKEQEIAQLRTSGKLATIEAKYPEVYAELGADAANFSDEKLAAMEARFQGTGAGGDEPPTPRGNNAPRNEGGAGAGQAKAETSADIVASMRSMTVPPEWGGQG